MNDQSTTGIDHYTADIVDGGALVDIDGDYEAFKAVLAEDDEPPPSMATTGLHGGGTAFDSADYATEEEADAAHEAFLMKAFGVSDEDD